MTCAPSSPLTRIPFDPRRLEALVTYAEAHRPSAYANPPVRRLLSSLAPPAGVIELRARGRTALVAAVVDRCDNAQDAAMLEVLGLDADTALTPLLAAATPVAAEVARAAGRSAVGLSLPRRLADTLDLAALGWSPSVGSYVMERDTAPWPSPALPPDTEWGDLEPADIRSHYALVREAFAEDPGMLIPDFETFAASTLAAEPPVRVLRREGEELGFARVLVQDGGRLGYVATIGRAPAARGTGVGAVVLAEALRLLAEHDVERFRLGVTSSNAAAVALYRAFGFEVIEAWHGWLLPVAA